MHNALKNGNVDIGPKTITVQWYKNILEAKKLIDESGLSVHSAITLEEAANKVKEVLA